LDLADYQWRESKRKRGIPPAGLETGSEVAGLTPTGRSWYVGGSVKVSNLNFNYSCA
jgi:hypothetical protein